MGVTGGGGVMQRQCVRQWQPCKWVTMESCGNDGDGSVGLDGGSCWNLQINPFLSLRLLGYIQNYPNYGYQIYAMKAFKKRIILDLSAYNNITEIQMFLDRFQSMKRVVWISKTLQFANKRGCIEECPLRKNRKRL